MGAVADPLVPPARLVARWRCLPRLAVTLARAFGPSHPRLRWLWPLTAPLWLFIVAFQRTGRSVLACGPAVLTVDQPRTRRQWLAAVPPVLVTLLVLRTILAPLVVVGARVGTVTIGGRWGALVGASAGVLLVMAPWVVQFVLLVRAARYSARLRRVLRPLRRIGPWLEVGSLASGGDPRSAVVLARDVLAWADEQGAGLAAVAVDDRLRRLYIRAGFQPAAEDRRVLLRTARPAGTAPGGAAARDTAACSPLRRRMLQNVRLRPGRTRSR